MEGKSEREEATERHKNTCPRLRELSEGNHAIKEKPFAGLCRAGERERK